MNSTLILIKSCWGNKKRRDACRETWLTDLGTDWADYRFVLGAHAPQRLYGSKTNSLLGEEDLMIFDEPDGFREIGRKLQRAFSAAVGLGYQQVVVLDDDTYVIPSRLRPVVETVKVNEIIGFLRFDAGVPYGEMKYIQGAAYIIGAGLCLFLSTVPALRLKMPDDVAIGKALAYHCTDITHDARFDPGPLPSAPDVSDVITTHKVKPQQMINMHARMTHDLQHINELD